MGVARADGMSRGLGGVSHLLGPAHSLRPSRRPASARRRRAIAGGITPYRAHGGGPACRFERRFAACVAA